MFALIHLEISESYCAEFNELSTNFVFTSCIGRRWMNEWSCIGPWSGLKGGLKSNWHVSDMMSLVCVLVTIRFLQESHEGCPAVLWNAPSDVSVLYLWNESWNFAALVTAWASASEPDIQQKIRSCTWTTLLMVFDDTYSLRREGHKHAVTMVFLDTVKLFQLG